ncbi:MAG: cytochrome c [Nitrospira sp.]|nr:cytochrome c [Nitrospira sp.]
MGNLARTPPTDKVVLRPMILSSLFLLVVETADLPPSSAQEYPPDLERGKALYTRYCRSCHGDHGEGDGPASETLPVPPPNFRHLRSILQSDEDLLKTIEHGNVFSPMHGWRGRLADGEMQDVLAYIRLLAHSGP